MDTSMDPEPLFGPEGATGREAAADLSPSEVIAERVGAVANEARHQAAEAVPMLEEKIASVESRVEAVRTRLRDEKVTAERHSSFSASTGRGLGIGLSVAYAIIGVPLVGFGAGWLIDRQAGTEYFKGLLALIGAAAAIAYALRTMKTL